MARPLSDTTVQPEGSLPIPETVLPESRLDTGISGEDGVTTSSGPSKGVHSVPKKETKNMPTGRPGSWRLGMLGSTARCWGHSPASLCRHPGSSNTPGREQERRLGAAWMALGAGEGFARKEALR